MVDTHGDEELIEDRAAWFADAHCHLDDVDDPDSRDALIAASVTAGVRRFVLGGYTPDTFERAFALRSTAIRVGAGLHPWAVVENDDAALEAFLEQLPALLERADSFGEIGLDAVRSRRRGEPLDRQCTWFRRALALAQRAGRPVVLHVVRAHREAQSIVRDAGPLPPFVVHGFVGDRALARSWLELGATLSFGGESLRSARTADAASGVPLDRLVIESDAPHGFSGTPGRASTPASVVDVARTLAPRLGVDLDTLAAATRRTTERLFFAG